jgi:RNA polymerase sigma-70 factor, ECF subfamily
VPVDLVIRAMHGDREAFSRIVQLSHARLYRTACLIVRDPDLAADAVQDALVSAWLDAKAIRDPSRFDAWLNRLLLRACFRLAGRSRRRATLEVPGVIVDIATLDRGLAHVTERDEIGRAFGHLTAEHRAALVAHHYLELTDGEAAAALAIPLGTYKSRLHRATDAMRAALEAEGRPAPVDLDGAREPAR